MKNLYVIETVDSLKLAELLNNYMSTLNRQLNIMIQINTSNEERNFLVALIKLGLFHIQTLFSLNLKFYKRKKWNKNIRIN